MSQNLRSQLQLPIAARGWKIRRFLVVWVGAIILAYALLCGGLLYAIAEQNADIRQILFDSDSLRTNRSFESDVISEGRLELLWRFSGDSKYQQEKSSLLENADALLKRLKVQADSPYELGLVEAIVADYKLFHQKATDVQHDPAAVESALDKLLGSIGRHRQLNQQQLRDTIAANARIEQLVTTTSVIFIAIATLLVLLGTIELWGRIFRPSLLLAQAATEFAGDLKARAPVLRDDEMGQLAATFNIMADAICDRENDRLRFVATVAHDLRNPLVVIGGASQLLANKKRSLSAEEEARWLDTINRQSRKLEMMIGDLMDGVQSETGELEYDMAEIDLAHVTRAVVDDFSPTCETHLVRYEGEAPCPIAGDRKRLERVVMNLLSNAVKYSPVGTEIFVTTQTLGNRALLSVRDQGAGIAADDMPRLFQPFFRIERTRRMASGTGLGLSSVKKIVEGHGGTIGVRSEPGQGSTFEISLPLRSDTPTSAARHA